MQFLPITKILLQTEMLKKIEKQKEMSFTGAYKELDGKLVPYLGDMTLVSEYGDDFLGEIRDYFPYKGKGKWMLLALGMYEEGDFMNGILYNGFVRNYEIKDNPFLIGHEHIYDVEIKNGKIWAGNRKKISADGTYIQEEFLEAKVIRTIEKKNYNDENMKGCFEGETKNGIPVKGKWSSSFREANIEGTIDNDVFTGKIIYDEETQFEGVFPKNICLPDGLKSLKENMIKGNINGKGILKTDNAKLTGSILYGVFNGKILYDNSGTFEGKMRKLKIWKGKSEMLVVGNYIYTGEWDNGIFVSGKKDCRNNFRISEIIKDGKLVNSEGFLINDSTSFIGTIKNGQFFNGFCHIFIGDIIFTGSVKNATYQDVLECKKIGNNHLLSKYSNGKKVFEKTITANDFHTSYFSIAKLIPINIEYGQHLIYRFLLYMLFSDSRISHSLVSYQIGPPQVSPAQISPAQVRLPQAQQIPDRVSNNNKACLCGRVHIDNKEVTICHNRLEQINRMQKLAQEQLNRSQNNSTISSDKGKQNSDANNIPQIEKKSSASDVSKETNLKRVSNQIEILEDMPIIDIHTNYPSKKNKTPSSTINKDDSESRNDETTCESQKKKNKSVNNLD